MLVEEPHDVERISNPVKIAELASAQVGRMVQVLTKIQRSSKGPIVGVQARLKGLLELSTANLNFDIPGFKSWLFNIN